MAVDGIGSGYAVSHKDGSVTVRENTFPVHVRAFSADEIWQAHRATAAPEA